MPALLGLRALFVVSGDFNDSTAGTIFVFAQGEQEVSAGKHPAIAGGCGVFPKDLSVSRYDCGMDSILEAICIYGT